MNMGQDRGIKNLLIIGHTYVGKSALCNVLCDTNDFDENENAVRKNKGFQEKVFVWEEAKYRVVEIGVSSIEESELYYKIGEVIYSMPEGISQVLFLVDERFTEEETKMFKLFEKQIFNSGIVEYTTIVRTKFENFKSTEICFEDKKQMCRESEIIYKMAKLCKDIIYVDNPPINIRNNDDLDRKRIKNNKNRRESSRSKLLNYLKTTCQEDYYKLKTWDELHNKIASYFKSNVIGNIDEEVERNLKLEGIIHDQKEKKNILIIGCIGSGKTTLANVLTGTENFKKSTHGFSKTISFQKGIFEWKGTKYCVIDTIGIGNTKLSIEIISNIKAKGAYSGISQVLLVVDKNFTDEINTLGLFGNDIFKYTTIVRTKFSHFNNKVICEKDSEKLREESEANARIIESCKGIIHVNNPSMNILYDDDDDDDEETNRKINEINENTRKKSRTILLRHLEEVCQEEVILRMESM